MTQIGTHRLPGPRVIPNWCNSQEQGGGKDERCEDRLVSGNVSTLRGCGPFGEGHGCQGPGQLAQGGSCSHQPSTQYKQRCMDDGRIEGRGRAECTVQRNPVREGSAVSPLRLFSVTIPLQICSIRHGTGVWCTRQGTGVWWSRAAAEGSLPVTFPEIYTPAATPFV
jgi:hypothetical protein